MIIIVIRRIDDCYWIYPAMGIQNTPYIYSYASGMIGIYVKGFKF
jgi:hypothetical protein